MSDNDFICHSQIVDMAQAPYDLNPILDRLMDRIAGAEAESEQCDKPVIVLAGEDHSVALSQIIQFALMKRLQIEGRTVAYGVEYPENSLSDLAPYFNGQVDERILNAFWAHPDYRRDVDLRHMLMLMDGEKYQYRGRFSLDHSISVKFNDAAIGNANDLLLDGQDANVARARIDLGYEDVVSLPRARPDIVHLRNLVIARNITQHINSYLDNKPDIYVQMLGTYHVLGQQDSDITKHYPYYESVKVLLQESGYRVISLALLLDEASIPKDADVSNSVFIQGWDKPVLKDHFISALKKTDVHSNGLLPAFQPINKEEQVHHNQTLFRDVKAQLNKYVLASMPK